jgi:hypothetical protein
VVNGRVVDASSAPDIPAIVALVASALESPRPGRP